jgi:hypothetical protein
MRIGVPDRRVLWAHEVHGAGSEPNAAERCNTTRPGWNSRRLDSSALVAVRGMS